MINQKDNPELFLRNPMLIHKIQDALLNLKTQGLMSDSIRAGAKNNIGQTVQMIWEQKHSELMLETVGIEILEMIGEYRGETASPQKEKLTDVDLDNLYKNDSSDPKSRYNA